MDFHSMSIGSSPLCSIYDFAAKLVKASDCNSEGVSSTLTEIFSYGKPDVKTYFLDAYEWFNRFELKEGENIYTYHEEDESLGEIRSLYLAKKKEQKLLLNN